MAATNTTAMIKKDLVIIVSAEITGEVEICETDTLKDVRDLIEDEFEDDMMLPFEDGCFCFHVNGGIRISEKQECKKRAWNLTNISMHSKPKQGTKRKLEEASTSGSSSSQENAGKRGPKLNPNQNLKETPAPASTLACASTESPTIETSNASNTGQTVTTQSNDSSTSASSITGAITGASASTCTTKDASFYSCDSKPSETTDSPLPCKQLTYQENATMNTATTTTTKFVEEENDVNTSGSYKHKAAAVLLGTPGLATEDLAVDSINGDVDDDEKTLELMDPDQSNDNDQEFPPMDDMEVTTSTTSPTTVTNDTVVEMDDDDDSDDASVEDKDDDIVAEDAPPDVNPHKESSQALEKSISVLHQVKSILDENPLFCSQDRRQDWAKEITDILSKSAPKTIIGVLGNTGVGKSSLLNAILDEAAVLPTSGSRGCTAAVVELSFNADLQKVAPQQDDANVNANANATKTPVYKGKVEFILHQEWMTELKILVDECSTEDKRIYARPPDGQRQIEAAAAWAKINQVYGSGTLEKYHGKGSHGVLQTLATNPRVTNLLTPKQGSTDLYNSILVEEGQVDLGSANAKALVGGFAKMNTRMRRSQKRWAAAFRNKINGYVYRKGNGNEPQTWPLIRKVVLHGPWPVLSTGACLVDLPGVRDANAARAKVSEQYLQNCNLIWIVAPIKRAVDDGTAKELLGEQFKRRLLMDGQYGNVSFICTQTDDCEATEIMRDHQDVALQKPGRWEKMTHLLEKITKLEKDLNDLAQEEEDLKIDLKMADEDVKASKEDLKEASDNGTDEIDGDDEDEVEIDIEHLEALQAQVDANKEAAKTLVYKLDDFKKSNSTNIKRMQRKCPKLQMTLKALCAQVRNEYSKGCLQADFRAGLKDLSRGSEEEEGAAPPETAALPDDFQMDVYCISSNDYLKIQGIKPASDGEANTFSCVRDTQVPQLRTFVHETTARCCETFSKNFVNNTSDMLDRVKLLATDAANVPSGRSSIRCMPSFEAEVNTLVEKIQPIVDHFMKNAEQRVKRTLKPSLKAGAAKGSASVMDTGASWGSTNRR